MGARLQPNSHARGAAQPSWKQDVRAQLSLGFLWAMAVTVSRTCLSGEQPPPTLCLSLALAFMRPGMNWEKWWLARSIKIWNEGKPKLVAVETMGIP